MSSPAVNYVDTLPVMYPGSDPRNKGIPYRVTPDLFPSTDVISTPDIPLDYADPALPPSYYIDTGQDFPIDYSSPDESFINASGDNISSDSSSQLNYLPSEPPPVQQADSSLPDLVEPAPDLWAEVSSALGTGLSWLGPVLGALSQLGDLAPLAEELLPLAGLV